MKLDFILTRRNFDRRRFYDVPAILADETELGEITVK